MTHLIQELIIILLFLPQRREMKMAVIILVIGWLLITTSSTVVASILAKPGCEEQCGDVTISFPFGIGSSQCFLDKWFEVSCDNSTDPPFQPLPFLKHTQLQILDMSVFDYDSSNQWVQVRSPVSFFDCPNKTTTKFPNLTASSLYIGYNKFVAVSCGAFAKYERRSDNSLIQDGCRSSSSTCSSSSSNNSNYIDFGNCNGTQCCSTPISREGSLEIYMDYNDSSTDKKCKYAFIIDGDETDKLPTFHDLDYVPVRLNWRLNVRYFDLFETHSLPNKSFYCNGTVNSSLDRISTCYCRNGYHGNPYILNGCEDINECEDEKAHSSPRCDDGSTCINTVGSYRCSYRSNFMFIGFASGLGVLFLVFGTWRSYKFIKKRKEIKRKKAFFKRNGGLLLEQQIHSCEKLVEKTKLFDSKELKKATNNFSNDRILGKGGQGTVYKGMLENGNIVAVKKSIKVDEAKLSEFINEVVILTQINHRNIVKLLGCCLETDVPVLVYEFVPNGTLSQHIHDTSVEFPFTWNMRLRIATEVAGALSYLHSAASFPIYHRDVKSTNILLDEKLRAKVADFGTSRTISLEQTHLTTLVYGTFGYLDPEYFQSSQFTDKSDVYSFGVILVELLTGKKAISSTKSDEEGRSLASYFIMTMEEESSLFDILDGQVLKDAPKEEIIIVAHLAKKCLHLNGRNRPTMREVAAELEQVIDKDSKGRQQIYEELEYGESLDYPLNVSTSFSSDVAGFSEDQELPLL